MMHCLIVLESPNKARTVYRFLKNSGSYTVLATFGHIKDLPAKQLGVFIDEQAKTVKIKMVVIPKRWRIVGRIKKASVGAHVLIGTDPDREGEAIAFDVAQSLKLAPDAPVRIEIHEVTPQAVMKAIANPRPINHALVDSQRTRRIIDRLVGYKISPLLWRKEFKGGENQKALSAGRVQSVALQKIVEREREIANFKPRVYFVVELLMSDGKTTFVSQIVDDNDKQIQFDDRKDAEKIAQKSKNSDWEITQIKKENTTKFPRPPHITSSLQQEAGAVLKWSPSYTMKIAQELFEGVGTPEGHKGVITYIRTDSFRIADSAAKQCRDYISYLFGEEYALKKPISRRSGPFSQGAHEAIRPTNVLLTPDKLKRFLSAQQYLLYSLIWKRFVASLMTPAVVEETAVRIEQSGMRSLANGTKLLFAGHYRLTGAPQMNPLPELKEGQKVRCIDAKVVEKKTEPPPRFTPASLIKLLEKLGIGRPSTYATIVNTLFTRGYVVKVEKSNALKPTEIGEKVADFLWAKFPNTISDKFTAMMEKELDKIQAGKRDLNEVVVEFYGAFKKEYEGSVRDRN